jgi:DNA-binding MarR family transcriptional regulator
MFLSQQVFAKGLRVDILLTPGHLVSLAYRRFVRLSDARLEPLGFSAGQVPVLIALEEKGLKTQTELADFAKVAQPPMAQMLARMERDGLIERTPDPDDMRSRRIYLTHAAKERLPDAAQVILDGNNEALQDFSEDERTQLPALLERVIANLDRAEIRSNGESR